MLQGHSHRRRRHPDVALVILIVRAEKRPHGRPRHRLPAALPHQGRVFLLLLLMVPNKKNHDRTKLSNTKNTNRRNSALWWWEVESEDW